MRREIYKFIGVVALFFAQQALAHFVPELIDIKLTGTSEQAYFEPQTVELIEGTYYLFVLENPLSVPYHFMAQTFPEAITTQYIQGSPSMTQMGFSLLPHSKVQWVFQARTSGEYPFYAQSYGHQVVKHKPGKIIIKKLSSEETLNQPNEAVEPDEQHVQQQLAQLKHKTLMPPKKGPPKLLGGRPD